MASNTMDNTTRLTVRILMRAKYYKNPAIATLAA